MDELQKFDRYMVDLSGGLGHADRHAGLRGYGTGLMSPLQRKSVEPMAAHVDPLKVRSRHQSLHHFVADANGSNEQMLLHVCQWVVPLMDFAGGLAVVLAARVDRRPGPACQGRCARGAAVRHQAADHPATD